MIRVPAKFFLREPPTASPRPRCGGFRAKAERLTAWPIVSPPDPPGTNINEALLRAIFILNEADNLGMLDPNSVSLIILVSDGDPTVGKYHSRSLVTDFLTVSFGGGELLTMGNLMAFARVSKPR